MSRNKDKYESNNNRRQQTFMSPEDVAAGKKTSWNSVEITGNYNLFTLLLFADLVYLSFRKCT